MNKIILSSASLHRLLYEFIAPLIPEQDDFEVEVRCNEKTLSFGDYKRTLDVESKSNWKTQIRIGELRRLFRLLTNVSEQPIVISFKNSHGWIKIFNLYV